MPGRTLTYDFKTSDQQQNFPVSFDVPFDNPPTVVCSLDDTGVGIGTAYITSMAWQVSKNGFVAVLKTIGVVSKGTVPVHFNWIAIDRTSSRKMLSIDVCAATYAPGNNLIFSAASVKTINHQNDPVNQGYVSADCYMTTDKTDPTAFIQIGDFPLPVPTLNTGDSASYTLSAQNLFDMSRYLGGDPSIAAGLVGQTCYVFTQIRQDTAGPNLSAGSFSGSFVYNGTTG